MESSLPFDASGLDASLVDAARAGSEAAFDELVDRYYPIVFRYLERQTGDPEWAEDLVQDTFLDAFRSISDLPENRTFRAWLFVIARNNYRTAARRRKVLRWVSLEWLVAAGREPAEQSQATSSEQVDAIWVQGALRRVPPQLREPLVLLSLGYSLKDTAEILEISHDAARQRASRGMRQLRELLARDQEGRR